MAIVPIKAAGFVALAKGSVPPVTGDTYVLSDSAADIAAIPAALWLDADGVLTSISVTDASLGLSVAAALAIAQGGIPITVPAGDAFILADTAASLDALTPGDIAALKAIGVSQITATDAHVQLSAAQDNALATAGITLAEAPPQTLSVAQLLADESGGGTLQPGQTYALSDTAAAIETLTPAQIAAIPAQVTAIQASGGAVALSAAQAIALETATLTVSAPAGATVSDSAASIAALTPAQLGGLAAIGVSGVSTAPALIAAGTTNPIAAGSGGTITPPPVVNLLFFDGFNTSDQNVLFVSDGTPGGTHQISGVNGIAGDVVTAASITTLGTKIVFNGTDPHGNDGLWVSDGSAVGTYEVTGIAGAASAAQGGLDPTDLTQLGSNIVFDGTDATGAVGVWETDGTASGTHEILPGVSATDITADPAGFAFIGSDGNIYQSNGTPGGTTKLSVSTAMPPPGTFSVLNDTNEIATSVPAGGVAPYNLVALPGGELVFGGTVDYTNIVGGVPTGQTYTTDGLYSLGGLLSLGAPGPGGFVDAGGTVYYDGISPGLSLLANGEVLGTGGGLVWQTDGTVSGTFYSGINVYDPADLVAVDGYLLASGEAYAGTVAIPGDFPNNAYSTGTRGADLFLAQGEVTAFYTYNGNTDYSVDGALDLNAGAYYPYAIGVLPTPLLESTDIFSGSASNFSSIGFDPTYLTVFDGNVYFNGYNTAGQRELWELQPNPQDGYASPFLSPGHPISTSTITATGLFLTAGGSEFNYAPSFGLDPTDITALTVNRPISVIITVAQLLADIAANAANASDGYPPSGEGYVVEDTAANIETLTFSEIVQGKALGVGAFISTDTSLTFIASQAQALEDPVSVSVPAGNSIAILDYAANIATLTPAQLLALPAIGVTAIVSQDASVTLSVAQAEALENPDTTVAGAVITVSAPQGYTVGIGDRASAIAGMTAAQIKALPSVGVTTVTATTGAPVVLSVAQAEAFETGIQLDEPPGGTVISDTAAAVAGMSVAAIDGLAALGVTTIDATGAAVALSAEQVDAIEQYGLNVVDPAGVSLDATASAVAAFTPADITKLVAAGVTSITITTPGATLSLSVQLARALENAGITLLPEASSFFGLEITDSAAAIATLTGPQIQALPEIAPDASPIYILSTNSTVSIDIEQLAALQASLVSAVPVELDVGSVTLQDTAAHFEALSSVTLTLPFSDTPRSVLVTTSPLDLSIAQIQAFASGGAFNTLSLPPGGAFGIVDSAGDIESFLAAGAYQADYVGQLLYDLLPLTTITATGGNVVLTVAEAESLEEGVTGYPGDPSGLPIPLIASQPGATVILQGNAAAIEGMSAQQLGDLTKYGVQGITVTDISLTLSVAQALALYDPVPITLPAGATIIIADTPGDIAALTPGELAGLAAYGVTEIEVSSLAAADALTIDDRLTVSLSGAAAAGATVTFAGAAGVLALGDTADMAGTIFGFTPQDTIDLTDVQYDPAGTVTLQSNNDLQVVENGVTYNLQLDPSQVFLTTPTFGPPVPDAGSGSEISYTQDPVNFSVQVENGQTVDGAVVAAGGDVEVTGGGTFNRGIIESGGIVSADYSAPTAVVGDVTIDAGGLLELRDGLSETGTIAFGPVAGAPAGGTLEIDDTNMPAGTLTGLQPGDIIHLTSPYGSFQYNSGDGATVVTGNVLQIVENGITYTLQLDPSQDFSADQFVPSDDLSAGTYFTEQIACFLAGTRIRTPRGEIPVEDLRAGDGITTIGGIKKIAWIGFRRLDLTRHPRPERARPIRIARDAFAPKVPARDLYLSPDHAVYWNGHLAEAKRLVNGTTITQAARNAVTYFHIELEAHDIIFAESLTTETYLDTGNRAMFENAAGPLVLHPHFTGGRGGGAFAPLACHGVPLAGIRRHLLDRAAVLGFSTTTDPALHILAGGTRIDPQTLPDGRYRFHIRKGVNGVRLRSRTGIPAHLLADTGDDRTLGVFIAELAVTSVSGRRAIDVATLTDGFYPRESEGIWTDGDARLDVAGPCILEITLAATLPYPHQRPNRTGHAA